MKQASILSTLLMIASSCAGELNLTLHGKGLSGQTLMVMVFNSEDGFLKDNKHIRAIKTMATSDSTPLLIESLAPGRYAIAAFVDSNKNGRLDHRFIGVPAEPYGFSNDARSLFGPPDFTKAAFELNDTAISLSIDLH